jgi:hypothetical protein
MKKCPGCDNWLKTYLKLQRENKRNKETARELSIELDEVRQELEAANEQLFEKLPF